MTIIRTCRVLALFSALACAALADERDQLHVGIQPDGSVVVPTNQILRPAGKQVTFPGRPVDLVLIDEGKTLVVKNMHSLVLIDTAGGNILQTLALPKHRQRGSDNGFSVVGLLVKEGRIYAGDSESRIRVAERQADGKYAWAEAIEVPAPEVGGLAHLAGLADAGPGKICVASSRGNCLHFIDLATGRTEQTVRVGVAPFMVCFARPDRCFVSNWGGDPPQPGQPVSDSSGTDVRIDPRTNVANDGTVSVVDQINGQWKQTKTIKVGLHPSGMALFPQRKLLYVANANSDTISVIDTKTGQVVESLACRPEARLPFGSGCNALALSPDGRTLYAANGTNNCVAVIRLGPNASDDGNGGRSRLIAGLIPTAWFPGAVVVSADGKRLFVANVKGIGTLADPPRKKKGKNSHDHLGSVSIIDLPNESQLAAHTEVVNRNNRLAYSLAGLEKPRVGALPVPIPERHGEPSVFNHVLYIIKENRTYDQVFGDMKEGNGDANLVMFGENTTPNHHALARQFTLLDNFYCSGVLSADGHSWADSAYVTDYLEKAFGGFTRSYPDDGKDALAFAPTGFLWNNALAHHKSFRNYGEFVLEEHYTPKGTKWIDVFNDHQNGTNKVPLTPKVSMKVLEPYTHKTYPYFPLTAADAIRADLFIAELAEFEKKGELPNLLYMSLPCDHTEGTTPDFPTPRAMVADNDFALGRIVEAISRSKFWKDTCILVVEDDPQDGLDHVDGHRTVALAISPYTRRRFVDHTNYNQTGMVKTIELILALPPMTQLDLSATPMRNCFQSQPDLTPYKCTPNLVALDEMNPPIKELTGKALYWAKQSLALNLEKADQANEDIFNRILWHSVRGYDTPYPAEFAGGDDDDD
jgi:YVTN family beta-propeller protein